MSGSISDLPGYVPTDAFRLHPTAIPPEQVVLERYTFLPYVRTGIAASLATPFSWDAPARAHARLTVPIVADAATETAEVDVVVRGPGDVTAFDPRQVIRCYPNPGAADALTEELAHVEFDRPDFPWLFTPTGPTPEGRLVPWLSLAVVPRLPGQPEPLTSGRRGGPATLRTKRAELPRLSDAWAWAHAQVMGGKAEGRVGERLSPANPAINLSRLLCPRHLEPHTAYVACVVPTFRAGAQVGLGQTPPPTMTLSPSWSDDADGDTDVVLPVYFSFTFSTGDPDDFKALAERLAPVVAPPGVGRRRVDTSRPGAGVPDIEVTPGQTAPGSEMVVEGPLVSLQPTTDRHDWPSESDQRWPVAQQTNLRSLLNAQEAQKLAPEPDDHPTLGPPLYAGAHVRRTSVTDLTPGWFRALNEDPRNRVVAAVGGRVVQHDQEAMMAAAWNQVAGVEAANAALRLAQLGRYVGASIHRRHLADLTAPVLLALTDGVHSRILDTDRTVRARVDVSSLPRGVTSGAFRRLVRPRGPVARFSAVDLAGRPAAVARLTAGAGALTRSYVRPYRNPDGIDGISLAARRLITPELVTHAWGAGGDHMAVLDAHAKTLARTSVTDALVGQPLADLDPGATLRPPTAAASALEQLLLALPSRDLIESDREAAEVARTVASQISAVLQTSDHWVLPTQVVQRVQLQATGTRQSQQLQFTDWTSVADNVARGALVGTTVTFAGGQISDIPGSRIDGTEVVFSHPFYDPTLPHSDEIHFIALEPAVVPPLRYELRFSTPVSDPVLYLGSVGSTLTFPVGTTITKLTGQASLTRTQNVVSGVSAAATPDGVSDSNGSIRLEGTFDSVTFTAVANSGHEDGIYLQVGVRASLVSVVGRPALQDLSDRLVELTAPHQLPPAFTDGRTGEKVAELIGRLLNPPEGALVADLTKLGKRLVAPGGDADIDRSSIHIPDLGLVAKLHPGLTVTKRVNGRLLAHPTWLRPDWFADQRVEPVMVAPRFDHPMYEALDRYDRGWLIPGMGLIQEPEMVTLLASNARFVETFLVGVNHEFARELLWREYPTDGRGTSFRSFWTSRAELIEDLAAFSDAAPLGGHVDPGMDGRIALVVRGELVRRYPGLVAHAVQQATRESGRPVFGDPAPVLFQVNLAPDVLLAGFDVRRDDVMSADPHPDVTDPADGIWWFTLAENPTEPRFGLDDQPPDPGHLRDDLTWGDLPSDTPPFLRPGQPVLTVTDGPPPPPPEGSTVWGAHAAAVAHILYQPPSRAAFRAAMMIVKALP